jgi:hypothetical protein
MVLYGIDPVAPGLRFLEVDRKSLAEGVDGDLRGDRATFRVPCVNARPGCMRVIRITASSEGRNVETSIEEWLNWYVDLVPRNISTILLRRVSQKAAPVGP